MANSDEAVGVEVRDGVIQAPPGKRGRKRAAAASSSSEKPPQETPATSTPPLPPGGTPKSDQASIKAEPAVTGPGDAPTIIRAEPAKAKPDDGHLLQSWYLRRRG